MGKSIKSEAMVGSTKNEWKDVCIEMIGIQIPNGPRIVLDN